MIGSREMDGENKRVCRSILGLPAEVNGELAARGISLAAAVHGSMVGREKAPTLTSFADEK